MSVNHKALLTTLENLLTASKVKDYCPNGLQVEGKSEISKLVTGVTASQALIDQAIAQQADAILVHHGFFWKGETPNIVGMKKNRIQALLAHNINLYAYHLPLDIHAELGNNAQLGKLLGLNNISPLAGLEPQGIVMQGEFNSAIQPSEVKQLLNDKLDKMPLHEPAGNKLIKRLAWCTGGGQGYIDVAAEHDVDAFITGEVSEQTIHSARELGVDFFAGGHHATERYGVKALGEYLQQNLPLQVSFIDIPNPA